jgi:hypothetical protein
MSALIGYAHTQRSAVMVTWGREVYTLDRDGQVRTQYQVPLHLTELRNPDDPDEREREAIDLVLGQLAEVVLAAPARRKIAEALGVAPEDVGCEAPARKKSVA